MIYLLKNTMQQAMRFGRKNTISFSSDDGSRGIATDENGNSYVTGFFQGSATFGSTVLTSSGGRDMFIAKYDAVGKVVWAQKGGGIGDDNGYGIAVDGSGNSYVTGTFGILGLSGINGPSATFGTTTLTRSGSFDIFIAKYDAAGNAVWAKNAGGTSSDQGFDIAIDGSGNPYITGLFQSRATFGSTILTASGSSDIFIAKYDVAGNAVWAQNAGGTSLDQGFDIAIDGSGYSYLTGWFEGSATFGSTTLTSSGSSVIFIAKYDAEGNAVWAQKAGGGWS
jgi:hypothetical protein